MTAPIATFNLSATVSSVSGPIAIGDVVVPIGADFYKATTANLATAAKRAQGVAMTAWSATTTGSVLVQNAGIIDSSVTGLGAGAASYVRVSAAGRLERATVAGADDVCGFCSADGTFYSLFGMLTATIVNGGTFGPPTGTGLPHIVGGVQNAAASLIVDADVTSVGVAKLTGLGANVATALGTFSSANIKTACTDETGSGGPLVFATSPTLTTPQIDGGRMEADSFRLKMITNATTGSQNDIPRAATIRCTADGLIITGIDATGAEDGEQVEIMAALAFVTGITLLHQNAGSLAANRIISWTAATVNMFENSVITLRYDATSARWRFKKDGF